jgi:3-oxoadipate enol-lactonase
MRAFCDIGTELYVEVNGDGEPVVLIHGLTLDCRMWQPQVAVLSDRFRVIRYDMRGFGKSADPPVGLDYRDRDDLTRLLDRLDIPSAHLVALSRGGRVALEFALHNPARVRNLVLIDTALRFSDDSIPQNDSIADIRRQVKRLVGEGRIDEARDQWLAAPIWQSAQGKIAPLVEQIVTDYFSGTHYWDSTSRNTDLRPEDLAHIKARTLVMVGANDLQEFKNSGYKICERIPHSSYLTIPDAGHLANIDNPAFVNDALIAFLTGSAVGNQ